MSKGSKKNFHIVELPLVVTPANEKIIKIRFDYARRIYNAILNDSLKILKVMKNSPEYKYACSLPKGKQRTESFNNCKSKYEFSYGKITIRADSLSRNQIVYFT